MAACGCSETPAPACDACGDAAPEGGVLVTPWAPRATAPARRVLGHGRMNAALGPPHKRWDGIIRDADEVIARWLGRSTQAPPGSRAKRPSATLLGGASPKIHPSGSQPKRWQRLAPFGPAGRQSKPQRDDEQDRRLNPSAWIPVVPRPTAGRRRASGPNPDGWPTRTVEAPETGGQAALSPKLVESADPLDTFGTPGTRPSPFRCDGWTEAHHAAPLLDPGVHEHLTSCQTDPDTHFRLAVTSIATLKLSNGNTRLYFFDGKFRNNLTGIESTSSLPPFVFRPGDNQTPVYKFTPIAATDQQVTAFWRSSLAPNTPVTELHFCRDLIGFLDSDDDEAGFPIYTPIVSNPGSRCDFGAKPTVYYQWRWDNSGIPNTNSLPALAENGRAGWRSTVIPCRGQPVSYQSHAVLRLDIDGEDHYLMLAVRCDGRGRGPDGTDSVNSDCCDICAPPGDIAGPGCSDTDGPCLSDNQIPTTDLVLFISPSANFQAGTLGPFGVLREKPTPGQGHWMGVPTAFESPDGEFVYLYVHPQAPEDGPDAEKDDVYPYTLYGLSVARKSDLRSAIRSILSGSTVTLAPANYFELHPGLSDDEVEAILEDGRAVLSPVFVPLGPVQVCGLGGPTYEEVREMNWVDEHFQFNKGRLNLYATHLQPQTGAPILDKISRYVAELDFDADALEDVLDGRPFNWSSFDEQPYDTVVRSHLRFLVAPCDVVVADALELWSSLAEGPTEVNDPAAETYALPGGALGTRLLFHSANAGGLMLQRTRRALDNSGGCDGDGS